MTNPQTEKAEGRYEMRICGLEILSITPQVSLGHVTFSDAREAERAAIVAYLRCKALDAFEGERIDAMFAIDEMAAEIERGDHIHKAKG